VQEIFYYLPCIATCHGTDLVKQIPRGQSSSKRLQTFVIVGHIVYEDTLRTHHSILQTPLVVVVYHQGSAAPAQNHIYLATISSCPSVLFEVCYYIYDSAVRFLSYLF